MIKSLRDTIYKVGLQLDENNRADCPFHSDNALSFSYVLGSDNFKCSRCGTHGGAVQFIQHFYNIDFRAALKYFGETGIPENILENRRKSELNKQSIAPTMDDAAKLKIINGHIETLKTIHHNMEKTIEKFHERMKEENHRPMTSLESDARTTAPKIKILIDDYSKNMERGGIALAFQERSTYEYYISVYGMWL